jgi:hypothetical protein
MGMLSCSSKSNDEIIDFFRKAAEGFRAHARTKHRAAADKRMQPSARKAAAADAQH